MTSLSKFGAVLVALVLLIQPVLAEEVAPTTGSADTTVAQAPAEISEAPLPAEEAAQGAPTEEVSDVPAGSADETSVTPTEPEAPVESVDPQPIAPSEPTVSGEPEASSTPITLPLEAATTTPAVEATTTPALTPNDDYVPGELLVKFKESKVDLDTTSGEAKATEVANAQGGEVTSTLADSNTVIIATDADPVAAAAAIKKDPTVEYAQPNYIYKATEVATNANDTYWGMQWALQNRGQEILDVTSTPDADIDIQEAWSLTQGDDVVVAVIDTGIALTHPDLVNNLWDGSSCVDENGTSIVGGCPHHGYDFGNNTLDNDEYIDDNDPTPDESHGTHVAGVIAAAANDGVGIAGVAPKAKIMAVRADTYGEYEDYSYDYFTDENLIQAIDFARQNNARIINASWGGYWSSKALYDAIDRFGDAGGIFIAAAGNDGSSNDYSPSYPASFNLPNIVSVAATDNNDELSYFSNYGETSVHVAAPGVDIVSSVPTHESDSCVAGLYACYSGTSMAAPHVAGIAALLLAYKPSLTVAELKDAIVDTGDPVPWLDGAVLSGRRVNAFNALASVATVPVTGDLHVVASVLNDDGRHTELEEFAFSLDHGTDRVFDGATTTLKLAPGTYDVTGVSKDSHTILRTNCDAIVVVVGGDYTCSIVFDDLPDTNAPTIWFDGDDPYRVKLGKAYEDPGAYAYDDVDGYVTVDVDTSDLNMNHVGRYTVVYTAVDVAGNIGTATRMVIVYSSGGGGGGHGKSGSGGGGSAPSPTTPAPGTPVPPAPGTPSAPIYHILADLSMGAQGADVLALQQALVAAGFLHVTPTGYFGPLTRAALIQYQLAHGIPGTGYFGPLTRASINGS